MGLSPYFKINRPQVIFEIFDDEVVLVNLENGNYYSLDSNGADIWNLIESGATEIEIVSALRDRYDGDHQDIEGAVQQFLSELQQDNLIVPAGSRENKISPISQSSNDDALKLAKSAFKPIKLQRFTDMQELLLLDPIHEVDETGWPNIKSDSSPEKSKNG